MKTPIKGRGTMPQFIFYPYFTQCPLLRGKRMCDGLEGEQEGVNTDRDPVVLEAHFVSLQVSKHVIRQSP